LRFPSVGPSLLLASSAKICLGTVCKESTPSLASRWTSSTALEGEHGCGE